MPTQEVATGFIRARISIGNNAAITGPTKFTIRDTRLGQVFEQSANPNTWYELPAAPGNYGIYATFGSVTSPGVLREVQAGKIAEEIDFNFGK